MFGGGGSSRIGRWMSYQSMSTCFPSLSSSAKARAVLSCLESGWKRMFYSISDHISIEGNRECLNIIEVHDRSVVKINVPRKGLVSTNAHLALASISPILINHLALLSLTLGLRSPSTSSPQQYGAGRSNSAVQRPVPRQRLARRGTFRRLRRDVSKASPRRENTRVLTLKARDAMRPRHHYFNCPPRSATAYLSTLLLKSSSGLESATRFSTSITHPNLVTTNALSM